MILWNPAAGRGDNDLRCVRQDLEGRLQYAIGADELDPRPEQEQPTYDWYRGQHFLGNYP